MSRKLVPNHENLCHFGCVKALGIAHRKLACIGLILANLRWAIRESFHVSQNGKDFRGWAPLISSVFFAILLSCSFRLSAISERSLKLPQMHLPKGIDDLHLTNIPLKCRPLEKNLIIIDAGHGGDDYGTHSLGTPKYHEKYLNLSTAQLVKRFLQQFGYQVIMTRTDDTFISLEDRAAFANRLNPRLFVSIHYNSAPSRDADGIEVFYYRLGDDKARVAKSKELARTILSRTTQNTQANSRGVKHGNYAVIRGATMPAVLIEGGFLTNEEEMKKIKTPAYMKQLALGIAQGIQDYLVKDRLLANTRD